LELTTVVKILLPTSIDLDLPPLDRVRYVAYDPGRPIDLEHGDADAIVLWANPPGVARDQAASLPRVRWVQTLQTGANLVLGAGFAASATLTSGRGLHDLPVAEHTLALVLAASRRLHELRDAQKRRSWAAHLGGRQPIHADGAFRSLYGARVLLWGYGSIARTLVPFLTALGANVAGLATSSRTDGDVQVHAVDEVDELLCDTDLLVLLLPGTSRTRSLLGAERLRRLPKHAWVVNVGRGDTIDEAALVAALQAGTLGGAALDVFEREPLPAESPLWDLPNVIVSPHAAGGRPIGARDLVMSNLQRFVAGEPLLNVVDRERGY
jgi:phosphoglycerate dehydrogenase-like enzyme